MWFAYSQIASYARQVEHYLTLFPKEHFLFLLTDDLLEFPHLLNRLQTFLELDDRASSIEPVRSNAAALPRSRALHHWFRSRSWLKEVFKPFVPHQIRHKLKMAAMELNLEAITPPAMDAEIANSVRRQYSEETKRLQDLIQRDLSKWLPA